MRALAVDVVIPAIGQETDKRCLLEAGLETNRDSTLKVGPSSRPHGRASSRPGTP